MLVMMHDLGTASSPYLHSVMGLKAQSMHELITESLRGAALLASWHERGHTESRTLLINAQWSSASATEQTDTKNVTLQL